MTGSLQFSPREKSRQQQDTAKLSLVRLGVKGGPKSTRRSGMARIERTGLCVVASSTSQNTTCQTFVIFRMRVKKVEMMLIVQEVISSSQGEQGAVGLGRPTAGCIRHHRFTHMHRRLVMPMPVISH
jgi:hypothetical protein